MIVVDSGSSNETANLRELFLEIAEKLLDAARSDAARRGMPKRREIVVLFRARHDCSPIAVGSTTSFRSFEKPDFRTLLLLNWQSCAVEDAERCAREHFVHGVRRERQGFDEKLRPITTPTFGKSGNQLGKQLAYETYYAIADLCERLQTLDPTQAQLREAYGRLIEQWTSPTVVWDLAAPLKNFRTETCPLRISQNLELSVLSDEDKTGLWNQNPAFFPFGSSQMMDVGDLARAQFVLRGSTTTGRDGYGFGPEFESEIVRAITALRLLKSGDVGAPAILGVSKGLFEKFTPQYVFDGRSRHSGRMYELRAADWDGLNKIYGALGAIERNMAIPLRRFNQAYGRQFHEDAILDLTIALESCLLPNTRDELQYRLSMRGAALLADSRNPVETQLLLKTVYEIRSEVVHNGKLLADTGIRRKVQRLGPTVAQNFVHACEDVTRDVLRERVLRLAAGDGTLTALSAKLDKRLLSGLSRLMEGKDRPKL